MVLLGTSWLRVATLAATAAVALFLWALLWPVDVCTVPACARKRFMLAIEVDAFRQVPPIEFSLSRPEGDVSLNDVMKSGGIQTTLYLDQLDIPFQESSGPLDQSDLYQLISHWRDRRPLQRGVDARLYALMTTALMSNSGEPLFGMMFDVAGREGFAVAPRTTARYFEASEPALVATLQLRTFLHELLHGLNRDHGDAAQMGDGRLTLEAPTRCISQGDRHPWSLREVPLLALSPETIHFFQSADKSRVLPGPNNEPFRSRHASTTECEDARANIEGATVVSRWQLALQRIGGLFSFRAFAAAPEAPSPRVGAPANEAEPPVELSLQALPAAYPLGYPIAVRILARNTGARALPIAGRLNPSYGLLRIEYRRAGAIEWKVLQPLMRFEPADDDEAMLAPGALTEQTLPIYFGEEGWTFDAPGEYQIRAALHAGGTDVEVRTEPTTIRIDEVRTDADRLALQPLINERGHLDEEVGRLLSFGGRIAVADGIAPLEHSVEQYGQTALGGAMRLTLLSQRLRRSIDPATGTRPAPDFNDARELLEDTCTDSGVAALTYQLLEPQFESIPTDLTRRVSSAAAAWDGTRPPHAPVLATYSDPTLTAWESTLHFCFNESELQGAVRTAVRGVARDLKRQRPTRIVLVGHGDYAGTCRINDALALRRANAVREALVANGVNRKIIDIVSLGERRPLDFSFTDSAHEINRRVEILVEAKGAAVPASARRILPRCSNQRNK